MNDGAKASTSSDGLSVVVDCSSGEVKQCVKINGEKKCQEFCEER